MSKRVFIFTLFAVMLLCTPVLWAQHYIGVRGGAGGGGVRFKPHVEKSFLWGSPVGGVAYKYYGGDRFVGGVEVDVNLVKKGYRTYPRVDSDSTYQRTLTAIELPFMWQPHVTFFKNKARFFINAGPYISYNISSREKLTSKKRGLMYDREYKLDNLVAIIDRNRLQISGTTEEVMSLESMRDRWTAFGWDVLEMNGDEMEDIIRIFHSIDYTNKKPHLLISHTTKGKGVSYMEGIAKWHHGVPTAEQYEEAVREISERIEKLEKENNGK